MAKKLTSVLGIDIGSQSIKVAELRAQGRDASLTAIGMAPTPEGAVDHTGIFNPDAVASVLKGLIADCGATVPQAVVSIAGQASVLVRTLEVPRMNPNELQEHMQWEINRNIPFAESTIVSDYRALPDEDPSSANMDVVMAMSPQSAIDTILSAVRKAGKSVAAIDVEPLAIARSLEFSYSDVLGPQTVCVVDIGNKTTAINIYKSGKLLMPRQVPIGGEMFSRAIADALQVSLTEADQIKQQRAVIPDSAAAQAGGGGVAGDFTAYNPFSDDAAGGFTPPSLEGAAEPAAPSPEPAMVPAAEDETTKLFRSYANVLEEFLAEVRRSIDYFRSRGGEVNKILVAGGGARMPGLDNYLSKSLGIECDSYDPTRRLNVNLRKVAPGFVEEHRQEFAVAIGNGLHIFFD